MSPVRVASRRPPRRPRAEWVAAVTAQEQAGLNGAEIARALGISYSFLRSLITDPTGEHDKRRKQTYSGTCKHCGAATNGYSGSPSDVCSACAPAEYATKTADAIIDAIREWVERFGRPPTAAEWNPSWCRWYAREHPNSAYAARVLAASQIVVDEDFPRSNTVAWRFGSFSAGIKAAGFEPRQSWRPTTSEASPDE